MIKWDFSVKENVVKAKEKILAAKVANISKRLSGIKVIQNGDVPVNSLKVT